MSSDQSGQEFFLRGRLWAWFVPRLSCRGRVPGEELTFSQVLRLFFLAIEIQESGFSRAQRRKQSGRRALITNIGKVFQPSQRQRSVFAWVGGGGGGGCQ